MAGENFQKGAAVRNAQSSHVWRLGSCPSREVEEELMGQEDALEVSRKEGAQLSSSEVCTSREVLSLVTESCPVHQRHRWTGKITGVLHIETDAVADGRGSR